MYDSQALHVLSYASGFTFWRYATTDDKDTVLNAGYFDAGADMLRVGDVILAGFFFDGDATGIAQLLVVANDDGDITVAQC